MMAKIVKFLLVLNSIKFGLLLKSEENVKGELEMIAI